jgi:endonuclease YncB( thermonuclease family)
MMMRRRSFLTIGTWLGAIGLESLRIPRASGATTRIGQLVFDSTASLVDVQQRPLTDDSIVAVWAENTAFNVDEDGDGNAVNYPDSVRIPLVASDAGIIGFGAPIVQDDTRFARNGNEEFVLNILDSEVGGGLDSEVDGDLDSEVDGGTVLFDEEHGQYYDTSMFEAFIGYAESNGYTIEATTDLEADLDGAQAAIITSPSKAFTDAQLTALEDFVAAGGSLLLFSQSDFGDYDATTYLNAIAAAVDAGFRFNDDQVLDAEHNVGPTYIPATDEFNTAFEYFDNRPGLGFEIDPTKTYTVDVVDVTDGDTIDIRFANGTEDTVRMLGIDSPETASQFERPEEWEGIESLDYLREEGDIAENYALDHLAGETVEISFDVNEPLREGYGRLLAYVSIGGTLYNQQIIADGHARVYDSGLTKHDAFLETERASRASERGLWARSNPNESTTIRNDSVDSLFFPQTSVISKGGPLNDTRVPVYAEPTARQTGNPDVRYEEEKPSHSLVSIG